MLGACGFAKVVTGDDLIYCHQPRHHIGPHEGRVLVHGGLAPDADQETRLAVRLAMVLELAVVLYDDDPGFAKSHGINPDSVLEAARLELLSWDAARRAHDEATDE